MEKLHNWTAKRAGAGITITHETGKLINVDRITTENGGIVAITQDGKRHHLAEAASVKAA